MPKNYGTVLYRSGMKKWEARWFPPGNPYKHEVIGRFDTYEEAADALQAKVKAHRARYVRAKVRR